MVRSIVHPITRRKRQNKERKSFSLGPEYVDFLKRYMRQLNAASLTAALEALIDEVRRLRELDRINAEIVASYEAATPEEAAEEQLWGRLSESQFAGNTE
jgi:hypothetical protein